MKKYLIYFLSVLRILVGWHFLYEGIAKLMTPGWSAKAYLMGTRWVFSDLFHQMAASDAILKVVDFVNIWGLILIGLSLFIGLLIRWSSISGMVLLLFYFVAYPPIPGYTVGTVSEGNYLWVNKTLIEFAILLVFTAMPKKYFYGIDRIIWKWKVEKASAPIPGDLDENVSLERREILRDLISVPFIGAFAYAAYKKKRWESFEEKFLTEKVDGTSGATLKSFNFSSLNDLKGQIPKGKIGDVELSRLILGGNLIGGWAHARDLLYASELVKAYHTDEKVMMTLQLAEKCGINTILANIAMARVINKYWHETGGKIQFISDSGQNEKNIVKSVEAGASAIYFHGAFADIYAKEGKFDEIAKSLELIRSYGKPAGIGGHLLETVQGCVKHGIKPDFWMKTLHHHNYWSAHPNSEPHDNMFCFKPQETIDYMNSLDEPWIAFKILAAGAIHPKEALPYAFNNGADFVVMGMYDFQIVKDCNIALDTLSNINSRVRPWMG